MTFRLSRQNATSPSPNPRTNPIQSQHCPHPPIRMYNRLVERCFKECVTRFRSKKMDDGELACVSKCAEKYLKLTSRAGFRFAEFQSQSAQVGWGGWCVVGVGVGVVWRMRGWVVMVVRRWTRWGCQWWVQYQLTRNRVLLKSGPYHEYVLLSPTKQGGMEGAPGGAK